MASTKTSLLKPASTTRTINAEKSDLLERFRDPKLCDIPVMNSKMKPDVFDEFRPKPCTVLDYTISQTDIKGQTKQPIGITKLHLQQTLAHYELPPHGYVFPEQAAPPPPPPPPQLKYSSGRGPVYDFAEDIWRRKVEEQQIHYRENLKRLIKYRKKYDAAIKKQAHKKLMDLVGPDWFQELSPKQLKTIDNLKNCIVKDVKLKTISHTEANMAELGLVLRPNPLHIKIALKKCCECPVEFLLILYQLMNRHRTEYSLNDRLLLSGVVHLTMRETLKELHIRIPSPPPPLKVPKPPPKKKKPKRYKSPYLVPFTFVPKPPKHTGIYKNNHIQYPESPYFSYINELKIETCGEIITEYEEEHEQEEGQKEEKEKNTKSEEKGPKILKTKKQSGITDEQEKQLLKELKVAQREYNKLADHEPVPFLRKPTIYIPCDHGIKPIRDDSESQLSAASENETNATVSVEVKVTTDFDEFNQPIRKVCECKITFDENKVPKKREEESLLEGHEGNEDNTESEKAIEEKLPSNQPPVAIKGNKVEKPEKASVALSTFGLGKLPTTNYKQSDTKSPIEQSEKELSVVNASPKIAEKKQVPPKAREQLVTLGKRESMECKCKEEVQKFIETNLCQCEKCKADREAEQKRKKPTYILSGMQEVCMTTKQNLERELEEKTGSAEDQEEQGVDAEKAVVPIIAGVKAKKICDCLQKYQARVKMYEEMKKRFDAQHDLKTLQKQYVIGGVTHSPTGDPVYMLSGVLPEKECACAKGYEEQLKEEKRLTNMPTIPLGRQKYIISGVHETEQGNVFVLSGAAAVEDCACLRMYKCYERKHVPCLQAFQEYLKKIEIDTEEYMKEIATDGRFVDTEPPVSSITRPDDQICGNEQQSNHIKDTTSAGNSEGFRPTTDDGSQKVSSSQSKTSRPSSPKQKQEVCQCAVPDFEDNLQIDTDLNLTLEVNKTHKKDKDKKKEKKNVCICDPNYDVSICQRFKPEECTCDEYASSSSSSSSLASGEPELKRFILLDKIPCKLSKQREILKKALEVLAEDGFPLAKLPDCYKLPHFKLWMQLRCGKYWTQEERFPFLMESYGHWRHYSYCGRKVKLPELDISAAEAAKYTWAHAKTVKRMAMEKDTWYYRKIRQANIGDGREFFPSTFPYEFPTPNFRDCYFAYTAAKEEECICWKPWYPHEIKDLSSRRPC